MSGSRFRFILPAFTLALALAGCKVKFGPIGTAPGFPAPPGPQGQPAGNPIGTPALLDPGPEDADAARAIKQLGGQVVVDPLSRRVVRVSLNSPNVADADLAQLKPLTRLQSLS